MHPFFRALKICSKSHFRVYFNPSVIHAIHKPFILSVARIEEQLFCKQVHSQSEKWRESDEGYLSFTKSSLYKLTLPLSPSSHLSAQDGSEDVRSDTSKDGSPKGGVSWEQRIESGETSVSQTKVKQTEALPKDAKRAERTPSVVFLLHSGQPLSYITGLLRAERLETVSRKTGGQQTSSVNNTGSYDFGPMASSSISFHILPDSEKHWSQATGIGDFLREAARVGKFTIRIGDRQIVVHVPSFEDRTRFLRASLHAKTRQIEKLEIVKEECDRLAKAETQRVAFAGAGVLGVWWVAVGYLTFHTSLGWDTMEPITYLTGLGTVISGYLWFLWHNREVSYRTVLTETTSKRQRKLYIERGFDTVQYRELIDQAKALRKAIKRVAWDYELNWEQGETDAGKESKHALNIIRLEETREKNGLGRMESETNGTPSDGENARGDRNFDDTEVDVQQRGKSG